MHAASPMTVLVVSPCDEDHAAVRRALTDSAWNVRSARTCEQGWRILHTWPVHVVLIDTDFPGGTGWKDLLDEIENMHSGQSVIVMSRVADERLWVEVLSSGDYDLLTKPLHRAELLQILALAARQPAEGYLCAGAGTFAVSGARA